MATKCEYEGCPREAEGWVEAQWTLVDFMRIEVCFEHAEDVYDNMSQLVIEGQRAWPAVKWYEPIEIDWHHSSHGV